MKHLVIITQKVDANDDLLGFFVDWIAEFAKHAKKISVITLAKGSYQFPKNVSVYSLGKEIGTSRFVRAIKLIWYLWRLIPNSNGVFAHMSPIFAIAAWPFALLFRKRLFLWYLHRSRTLRLRMALMLCDRLFTADASSLSIKSPKIVAVGHGIQTQRFAMARNWSEIPQRPVRILSIGRISPIKDFETAIRAIGILRERGVNMQLRIVGRAVMPRDHSYAAHLNELVDQLELSDRVQFIGFVPYHNMRSQYEWGDVIIGCTPSGGIDKVILEGMSAGYPALTSNEVMRPYLEPYADQLLFQHGNARELADKLQGLNDWEAISSNMTASVEKHHNLARTIERIFSQFQ